MERQKFYLQWFWSLGNLAMSGTQRETIHVNPNAKSECRDADFIQHFVIVRLAYRKETSRTVLVSHDMNNLR